MNTLIDFFLSLFRDREEVDVPELSGRLRYKINGAGDDPGKDGEITEGGFGETPRRFGTSIAYGNLLDQRDDRYCGPYLKPKGTARQYNEGVPDPNGPGFEKNIRLQCELAKSQGHSFIELDNPDDEHFSIDDVIHGIDIASDCGLSMVAKNPGLLNNHDALIYVSHPNIFGIIVEKNAGTPQQMDSLRQQANKPMMPVWFVFFGHGRQDAVNTAKQAEKFKNMYVTYDKAAKEYGGNIEDITSTS